MGKRRVVHDEQMDLLEAGAGSVGRMLREAVLHCDRILAELEERRRETSATLSREAWMRRTGR